MFEEDPIQQSLWGSLPVAIQATVADSTAGLACRVLDLRPGAGQGGFLTWNTDAKARHASAGEMFWEFLNLESAVDAELVDFAQAYGTLLPSHGGSPIHQEPIAGWRALCRGMNAIYDLALFERGWGIADSETRVWARAATLALAALNGDVAEISEPEVMLANLGGLTGAPPQGTPLEHAVSAFLQASRIAPRFSLHEAPRMFAVPVIEQVTVDHTNVWEVDGALPILAISLATAVMSLERPRCTRCGKVARKSGRRPHMGSAWFGDHEVCRAEAKQDAVNRYLTSRALKLVKENGSHAPG